MAVHGEICCDDADGSTAGAARNEVEVERARIVLGLAYDGTDFHGFAAQPGQRTVAGELASALGNVFGEVPRIVCAGRTDSGVHARNQVVHADVPLEVIVRRFGSPGPGGTLRGLAGSLSHQVGQEIAVFRAEMAQPGFDARRSAIWRRYRYLLDPSGHPEPYRSRSVWTLESPIDLAPMRLGADALLGEHDFAAFCRRVPGEEGPIRRRVLEARFIPDGEGRIAFEITAVAFCHQMVRSIVGLLVAIGRGAARPPEVVSRLRSGSRVGAPTIAPAKGLCLIGVGYPDALGGAWT